MGERERTPLAQHPVVEVIGYLDERAHFPVGSLVLAILCFVYLLNLTAGFFPEIPDNFPFIGNIDEGLAGVLLAWSIFNIIRWAKVRRAQRQARQSTEVPQQPLVVVEGQQPLATAAGQQSLAVEPRPTAPAGEAHPPEEGKEQR